MELNYHGLYSDNTSVFGWGNLEKYENLIRESQTTKENSKWESRSIKFDS
jgi:hypothetical protein